MTALTLYAIGATLTAAYLTGQEILSGSIRQSWPHVAVATAAWRLLWGAVTWLWIEGRR